ncbi:hypothetical protein K488DRAFT_87926 [Vararia minispora EC-137]|uniref:Uncharacterized protein n=1 Tax=Vararia minispora EC-137 TaxID=1314806 RepID=A0ACB8QEZ4_9AGAM|nr:hypothetical protein K488DRAFT_87926 [Vararia minispora EC-137]
MSSSSQNVFSVSSTSMLPRGKACLNCKHRKMKCDGAQPVCGPCARLERRDCEYVQGQAQSSTHSLEKKVANLRARLKDLQDAGSEGSRSNAPSSRSSTPAPSPHAHGLQEIPAADMGRLMDYFFSQDQPLWFLYASRFRTAAMLPQDRPDSAPLALVNAVCLLSAACSPHYAPYEPLLLARALSSLNDALQRAPVSALQTHVLLAAYLLNRGRQLEGRVHLSNASNLAISCGLHNVRSSRGGSQGGPIEPVPLVTMSAPRDQIAEGERINGFWTVFALERVWGAALGAPARIQPVLPSFPQGIRVDVPWPLSMSHYEHGWIDRGMLSSDTVWNFFRTGTGIWDEPNALSLVAKSAVLLERTSCPATDAAEAHALDARIAMLVPVTAADPRGRAAHVLLRGAMIQLYTRDSRALDAARGLAAGARILRPGPGDAFGFLEPAIGTVLPAACRVLIAASATGLDPSADRNLDSIQDVLAEWAPRSSLIGKKRVAHRNSPELLIDIST